jgi:hypothetical protein
VVCCTNGYCSRNISFFKECNERYCMQLSVENQWLPGQDTSRPPLTLLNEGQAVRIRDLERLVA